VREIRLFAADLPKVSKPHAISRQINEVLTGKHDFSISLAYTYRPVTREPADGQMATRRKGKNIQQCSKKETRCPIVTHGLVGHTKNSSGSFNDIHLKQFAASK
jgi:hypothetical protein